MPFNSVKSFEKSFPSVRNLPPKVKAKALDIFNALVREGMTDGRAIAIAISRARRTNMKETFFTHVKLQDDNETIVEVLRIGMLQDRKLDITENMLDDFVNNFNDDVYGTQVPVNLEHKRGSEAAGWVVDLFIEDNKLFAKVEWTELGEEKIEKDLFKFVSAELALQFPHHKTGKKVKNVFIGLALTNTPALKQQEPLKLEEEYLFNKIAMFKTILADFKKRDIVSKEDKELLNTLLEEAPEGEVTEEVKADVAEVEAKPEEAAPTEATDEEKEKEAEEEKKAEELKEKAQQAVTLEEKLGESNQKLAKLEEKIERTELTEVFDKSMMLSGKNNVGFNKDSQKEVVDFMLSLEEGQRDIFKKIVADVRAVDLSEVGSVNVQDQINGSEALADAIVKKTVELMAKDKDLDAGEAQKQATKELSK